MESQKIVSCVLSDFRNLSVSLSEKKVLEKELDVKFVIFPNISELFSKISNSKFHTNYVIVDLEKFYEVQDTSVFDLLKTLNTLISCSSNPGIALAAALDLDCDQNKIKELISTNSLAGFYPRGTQFSIDEKRQALQELISGNFHIPARIKKLLKNRKRPSEITRGEIYLTTRQKQILSLITRQGASNKVIARTLNISESTVKLHMTAILKKFGARNRTQLAVFAKNIE